MSSYLTSVQEARSVRLVGEDVTHLVGDDFHGGEGVQISAGKPSGRKESVHVCLSFCPPPPRFLRYLPISVPEFHDS